MSRKTTVVEKIKTMTRIIAGGEMRYEPPRIRNWAANQLRGERARRRKYWGEVRGLDSVGFAGLRRG